MVLSAIGLYGLVSYSVAQRTQELGIRMALGASRRELVHLVLDQGLRLALVGSAIGIAAGLAAARVLVALMPGIEPNDPIAFVAVNRRVARIVGRSELHSRAKRGTNRSCDCAPRRLQHQGSE